MGTHASCRRRWAATMILVAVAGLIFLVVRPGFAQMNETSDISSSDGTLAARGIVESIADDGTIALRTVKRERILIFIAPDTLLEGLRRIDDLERKQQVRVWYTERDGSRTAVRIELIPDLGC